MSGPVQKQNGSQRIRGPKLEVFRERVTFDEAVRIAEAENRVLPSNKRVDQEIMEDGKYKALFTSCWTGTLIAHAEAGKPLGKNIVYTDPTTHHRWIFPVPDDLQEKTDCVLVTEHPHYRIEIDRNDLIIHASYLTPLEAFPQEDGGYRTDPHHCIPLGEKVGPDDPGIRYLTGRWHTPQVVPVNRGNASANKKHIFLFSPSSTYDMVVEAPAEEQKEAVPEPAQEEAKKKPVLVEGNQTIDRILLHEISIWRDMLGTNSPESIFSEVKSNIDFLVTSFKLAKTIGSDTRPHVRASDALGNFVTKELASDPRYEHLVPELRKYYAQKLREVLK